MLCSDCGTDLPDGASFCPKCGAPQKGVDCPITASGMVYLFADRYVERLRFVGDYFGESVPCTDRHVQTNKLSEMLVAAAFIWLEKNGLVTLNRKRKKEWYRPLGILPKRSRFHDRVSVEKKRQYRNEEPDSLESYIWNAMDDTGNVFHLTLWVIGGFKSPPNETLARALLEQGHFSKKAIKIVKDYLFEKGYFTKKNWLVPSCEKIAELKHHIEDTQRMIAGFKERKPEVYRQLIEDIQKVAIALEPPREFDDFEPPGAPD